MAIYRWAGQAKKIGVLVDSKTRKSYYDGDVVPADVLGQATLDKWLASGVIIKEKIKAESEPKKKKGKGENDG